MGIKILCVLLLTLVSCFLVSLGRKEGRDKQFTDTGEIVREKYTIEPGVSMYTLVEALNINFLSHFFDKCKRCNNCNWLLSVELIMTRIMTRRWHNMV